MKELLLKEAEKFIDKNMEMLENMKLSNIGKIERFRDMDTFHRVLKLDKTDLNYLIKKKELSMIEELNDLLTENNLPVRAENECGSDVAFYFNEEKIGRINLYDGKLNVFNTSIEQKYNKSSVTFYTTGFFINKPNCKIANNESKNSTYTTIKNIDNDVKRLKSSIDNLKEKKNTFLARKQRFIKKDFKKELFWDRISYIIHKDKWIEAFDLMIKDIDTDIKAKEDFIAYLKNITTSENEYIEILSIKNGLEDVLNSELGV